MLLLLAPKQEQCAGLVAELGLGYGGKEVGGVEVVVVVVVVLFGQV